jgi:hypothetical protein
MLAAMNSAEEFSSHEGEEMTPAYYSLQTFLMSLSVCLLGSGYSQSVKVNGEQLTIVLREA